MTRDPSPAFGWTAPPPSAFDTADDDGPGAPLPEARYVKLALLGEGGMGRVWLGHDTHLDRSVAIKEPRVDGPGANRLLNEARLSARLEHPGVVAIHDVFYTNEQPHFVMALVSGRSLAAVLADVAPTDRRSLMRHALEVADVIAHAHRLGILHRDISPANILIASDGASRVVDWGLAISAGQSPVGHVGTPGFAAPELMRGAPASPRSDVWSIGAIMHAILCGAAPAGSDVDPALDPELQAILKSALDPDPTRRYPDAGALAVDLRRWFEGRPVLAHRLTPAAQLWRLIRFYKGRIALAVAIVLVVTAALGYGLWATAREAELARAAERKAVRAAAALLRGDAESSLRRGDLQRAKEAIAASFEADPSPEARGLWMQLKRLNTPTLVEARQLPECPRWILTRKASPLLCDVGADGIQAWRDDTLLWQRAWSHQEVRTSDDHAFITTQKRQLVVVDLETGHEVRRDDRPGFFASRFDGEWLLSPDRRAYFAHDTAPRTVCELGIAHMHRHGGEDWIICREGAVVRITATGDAVPTLVPGADQPAVLAHAGGRLWFATSVGAIVPMDGRTPRLDAGTGIHSLEAMSDGIFLVARGHAGLVRVIDTETGQWVASFGDDVVAASPATEGLWILRKDNVLERWLPHRQPLLRIGANDGFASLAWSPDGMTLAATDGGGFVHLVDPKSGLPGARMQLAPTVAKAVAFSPHDGLPRVLTMDTPGLWRIKLADAALHADLEPITEGSRSGFGIFHDGSRAVFDFDGHLEVFPAHGEGSESRSWKLETRFIRRIAMAPGATRALLIGVDGEVFDWDGRTAPKRLAWPPTRYAAIAGDGRVARIDWSGDLEIRDNTGQSIARWSAGTVPISAIGWRNEGEMVITGHRDGTVRVFDVMGRLEAVASHHNGLVSDLASSPDGRLLATASWDATVSISSLEALDPGAQPVPEGRGWETIEDR